VILYILSFGIGRYLQDDKIPEKVSAVSYVLLLFSIQKYNLDTCKKLLIKFLSAQGHINKLAHQLK
jgi:hypothetical protein